MARFRLLNCALLALVLAVGLTMASGTGPDVHECPPGCAGTPVASATS